MPVFKPKVSEQVEAIQFQFDCSIPLEDGDVMEVKKMDFLVTRNDGTQFVMPRNEFLLQYEPILKPGRKPKGTTQATEAGE